MRILLLRVLQDDRVAYTRGEDLQTVGRRQRDRILAILVRQQVSQAGSRVRRRRHSVERIEEEFPFGDLSKAQRLGKYDASLFFAYPMEVLAQFQIASS